jgi:isopenicillin N synthase-like dioxygenase
VTLLSREILELGKRIFPLLALALELPETFFDDKVMILVVAPWITTF